MADVTTISDAQSPWRAYFVLLVGVAAVSLAAIFIRLAQDEQMPSILIAGGRLLVAALILTPAVWRRPQYVAQIKSLSRRDAFLVVLAGFFLAMHFVSWVTSLEYTTVLISVVLVTTTPIWVALLELFVLRSRLSQLVILGLGIALIGGTIIGLSGEVRDDVVPGEQIQGAILSVVGAMTVAVYLVIGRKLRASLALTPYIWAVYSTAAFIVAGLVLFSSVSITGHPIEGYFWVLLTGLIPQLIGHSSLNYALAYLPATYVSLSTQLEPILSAIVAIFVFNEIPGVLQILGGAVIICGVTLASIGQSSKKAA